MADANNIYDSETLVNWLSNQSLPTLQLLASRSALRTMPFLLRIHSPQNHYTFVANSLELTLNSFRTNFISWAATKYPTQDMKAVAEVAANSARFLHHPFFCAESAALAAEFAAISSISNISAPIYNFSSTVIGRTDIWGMILTDARAIELDIELIGKPLWFSLEGNFAPPLRQMREQISEAREFPEFASDGTNGKFDLWLDWYDAQLENPPRSLFGETKDIELATQSKEFWEGDAHEVMERVAELVGWPSINKPIEDGADITNDLEQRIAAHNFGLNAKGKIAAKHIRFGDNHSPLLEDMRAEVVEKIIELQDRLEKTQAPDRVKKTLSRLNKALVGEVKDIRPGILLMRSRSLEADAAAYAIKEARDELTAATISMFSDLAESVADLKGAIPDIMDLEAA